MAGGQEAFFAFRDLALLVLKLTVLRSPQGSVRLTQGTAPGTFALGGWNGPDDPLPLNDDRYLRLSIALYLEDTPHGSRLKVSEAGYQYQTDRDGDEWIFRYDYVRHPPDPHPASHLHIRAAPTVNCLPPHETLGRVHFPTGRVAIEAIIRLLADQFGVRCNEPPEVWRPVLAESERLFLAIAHQPHQAPPG